jgi:hypothetical protein
MSLIVEKAKDIRNRLTSHGIAFYTSGQLFLEEYYALALIGKAGLNALHMYVIIIQEALTTLTMSLGTATLVCVLLLRPLPCGSPLDRMGSLDLT